ncbi:GFA family protein [Variovorax sp. 1763]|uniref:GFA family protein n=1 Tax=Variovorax paradoxus TaxID=34073 RepID=UPI001AE76FA8
MGGEAAPAEAGAWQQGHCHCGAVRFEFLLASHQGVSCNCSYCVRKAALHHRVPAGNFRLLAGAQQLSSYRFGTMRARHLFCSMCGIHTHCHPRSAPEEVNVNLHCVDALLDAHIELSLHDGRGWAALP